MSASFADVTEGLDIAIRVLTSVLPPDTAMSILTSLKVCKRTHIRFNSPLCLSV